jgi:hypothetical protein
MATPTRLVGTVGGQRDDRAVRRTDIALGADSDRLIPQALTGKTIQQLEAESADAYGMFDFTVRINGWTLVLLGVLLALIVLIPFRRGERWAWWAAWALPIWAAVVPVFFLVAGVHPDQPPPQPVSERTSRRLDGWSAC